jgi:serine/threonine-protein kinase RsbW
VRERIHAARTLTSDPLGFRDVRAWIVGVAQEGGLAASEASALAVAVNEMCANVHRHAYGGRRDGPIDLSIVVAQERVTVTLAHRGSPFDPRRYVPPDLTQPAERGYGMYIVSRLVDQIRFESTEHGATIVLVRERIRERAAEPAGRGGR